MNTMTPTVFQQEQYEVDCNISQMIKQQQSQLTISSFAPPLVNEATCHHRQPKQQQRQDEEERAGLLEDLSWHAIDNFDNDTSDLEVLVGHCGEQEDTRVLAARKQLLMNIVAAIAVALVVVVVLGRYGGSPEPSADGGGPSSSAAADSGMPAVIPPSIDNPGFG